MANGMESTWDEIQNKCLSRALDILNGECGPYSDEIDNVDRLLAIAIAIEDLNLRWAAQQTDLSSLKEKAVN